MAKSILVVDDEAAVTFALEGFFRQKGYDVLKAFYGDQALEQIEQKRPSVVILDLQMPGINGVEVLRKIKSDYPEIKTLVITGFSDQYQQQLDQLKAEKVLAKPVSLTDLTREVEALLQEAKPAGKPAGKQSATGALRLLFVEGSAEAYEQVLKPYFESEDRTLRFRTALARNQEEALRLAGEFKPQLIVMDGSRMPVGVDAGGLAARLTGASSSEAEVILTEIPSAEYQIGATPAARLEQLEEAVQAAVRKYGGSSHASQ